MSKKYDITSDPSGYITNYHTAMHLQGAIDDIFCRVFFMKLEKEARSWYNELPVRFINSLCQLNYEFTQYFAIGKHTKKSVASSLEWNKHSVNHFAIF